MRNFRRPGLWLGIIAIVLAMGGSAVAASKITGAQIKDGTITGKDIKRGSIGTSQLSGTALAGMEGPQGASGPVGPAGPAGATGPAGPSVVGQLTQITSPQVGFAGSYAASATATCPAGQRAVSGGGASISTYGVVATEATASRSGWFVVGGTSDYTLTGQYVQAWVMCGVANVAVASSNSRAADAAKVAARVREINADVTAWAACKKASVGGKTKCLQVGEFCATRNQSDYRRAGFKCVSGRLRKS